jgi:allantoate deiminase
LLAITACGQLARTQTSLPFHVDVLGFSDEEGFRFHSTYLGSKALAGLISEPELNLTDVNGVTLAQAVGGPDLPTARYRSDELLGYVEAHIEQGPVLESKDLALGVVSAIAAQGRYSCTFTGLAGHAGTTPMTLRQDALAGAAEFITLVEKVGRETDGLVATVGQIKAEPNVSNVIAQHVSLTLDVRQAQAAVVAAALERIATEGGKLSEQRRLQFSLVQVQSSGAVDCDPSLTERLAKAVEKIQSSAPLLISGAGHDGVILSRLTPIAMLFIRCRHGLSHHPDEYVEPEDIAYALEALTTFIQELA